MVSLMSSAIQWNSQLTCNLVDCFELLCQTIEYEKKYKTEKDLNEFLHVRKRIQNDFVKKWVDDALVERKEFWAQHGKEAVISN